MKGVSCQRFALAASGCGAAQRVFPHRNLCGTCNYSKKNRTSTLQLLMDRCQRWLPTGSPSDGGNCHFKWSKCVMKWRQHVVFRARLPALWKCQRESFTAAPNDKNVTLRWMTSRCISHLSHANNPDLPCRYAVVKDSCLQTNWNLM